MSQRVWYSQFPCLSSAQLTMAEFKTLLAHWADFDANKDKLLAKLEVPELFAALFDQADANHDGQLDEKERAKVAETAATPQPAAQPGPGRRPNSAQ